MEEDYGYLISDDKEKSASCTVIRKESLLAAQKEDLARVMDLLSINETLARTLLMHYHWDVNKVLDVLVERGEDKLYAEAGIPMTKLSSSHFTTEVKCGICFGELSPDNTTSVDCGHSFCNDCWTEYFIVKINEGQSRRITCMAHACNAICDEGKIRTLVSLRDPRLAVKFDCFLLESYIEDNKRVKWCPSVPHCGNAIRIEKDEYCEVECACGLQFCFNCLSEAHSPCSCLMWELWRRKCNDDWASEVWIVAHTTFCPKCHMPVEKNGGFKLVTCICGQSFCWLCGGPAYFPHDWERNGNHKCVRYEEEQEGEEELAIKEACRFTHCYNRYEAYTNIMKAEANLKEELQHKIATLEEGEMASRDFSWVLNGFDRLSRSRQILSYSYPFAYYMFGNELFQNEMSEEEWEIKQNLFESQQQQLERNIESLSMLLEEPFSKYDESQLTETKMKIIHLAAITDDSCKRLYDFIENELLGSFSSATDIIAPYRSKGVRKASELSNTIFTKQILLEGNREAEVK